MHASTSVIPRKFKQRFPLLESCFSCVYYRKQFIYLANCVIKVRILIRMLNNATHKTWSTISRANQQKRVIPAGTLSDLDGARPKAFGSEHPGVNDCTTRQTLNITLPWGLCWVWHLWGTACSKVPALCYSWVEYLVFSLSELGRSWFVYGSCATESCSGKLWAKFSMSVLAYLVFQWFW